MQNLPRSRNEAVLAAVLLIAAATAFAASAIGWNGTADWWFYSTVAAGSLLILAAMLTLGHLFAIHDLENDVRASVFYVKRDEFVKEPPIRGKGPIE
ncbi:MAG: hypothetical protein J6Y18_02550 [Candidatus Methanomethylophilaceae archaeon]|nr:hypothetical protein [Candidatus Methanomethylophilaceae archaeon]